MADNPYPYDTGLVRELLKDKRKVRGIRSCFPCRHRKVRCDGQVPCFSCVKRNHPELCRVPNASGAEERAQRSSPGSSIDLEAINHVIQEPPVHSNSNPELLISRLEKIEEQISSLKADLRSVTTTTQSEAPHTPNETHNSSRASTRPASKSPGRYFVEDATGATIYLGSRSDAPLVLGCRQPITGDSILQSTMMDQFVPRAYPFTNLWGLDATAQNVCETLPDDSDLIRYWQTYQLVVYPFYPVLVTAEEFSQSLFAFLDKRALSREANTSQLEEPDSSWLALLFAVLACGAQFSDDPIKERDLRSRVFICSSFQCLRLSNFFNNTNFDQIQAMALIGHCLRNNLDTNSAWILMGAGATIRLAQSIGLHEQSSLSLSTPEQYQRNRLWWMLIWQDTFLCFTYDRPPSSITTNFPVPLTPNTEGLSFLEAVLTICQIILDCTRPETSADPLHGILESKRQLEGIWNSVAPFLSHKSRCTSLQHHLERLALGIHLGYSICRLTWMYLEAAKQQLSSAPSGVAFDCAQQAVQVIESFLDLYRFSANVCRSWAFVHNAVSCAITLKSLEQMLPEKVNRAEIIFQRLIFVLEKEEKGSEWCDADTNVRYFGPYSRALKALREVYHETAT